MGAEVARPPPVPEAAALPEGSGVEERLARVEAALERMAAALETLVDCHEKRHGTSSGDLGAVLEKSA